MFSNSHKRPFTEAVNALRAKGYRFQDLSVRSDEARSTAWFNNLVNSNDPWAVAPPSDRTWPGLAGLLGITEQHLRELVAAEWFDVTATPTSHSTRAIADLLADLPPRDIELVTAVARRLKQGPRHLTPAETFDEALEDMKVVPDGPDLGFFANDDDRDAKP